MSADILFDHMISEQPYVQLRTKQSAKKWVASKGRLTASGKDEATAVRIMATKWFGLCLLKQHGFELTLEQLAPGRWTASLGGAR